MASSISAEPDDRQSLSTFRTMGGMAAGMIVNVLPPLIVYDKVMNNGVEQTVLNGPKFTLMAGVFSVLAIGCYLLCYKLVTERVRVAPSVADQKPEMDSVPVMLKKALTNRALISIICASIVMLLAQLTMQQMATYVFPNFYNNAGAQSMSSIFMMFGMVVAAIVAKPLASKFGKAELSIVTNLFAGVVLVVCWIIRPENVWVFCGFLVLVWLGLGMFAMVSWALITDVIDYSEIKEGKRQDGQIYSLYSFARKLGQALSAGVSGWLLSAIGYSAETAFDTPVVNGIFTISTLIPAIGLIALALILWFWYPLHKKQVDANVAFLKEKHGR
jgi:GPH family glycoside/pentoside/hexuronide:cation symporter